jgi:hypothetical protein
VRHSQARPIQQAASKARPVITHLLPAKRADQFTNGTARIYAGATTNEARDGDCGEKRLPARATDGGLGSRPAGSPAVMRGHVVWQVEDGGGRGRESSEDGDGKRN